MSHYVHLYNGGISQKGGSLDDIVLYDGPSNHHHSHHTQHGAGLGHFFSKAFEVLHPLLSSGVNALKHQGIKSTRAVLSQLGKKDIKTILKEEGERAVKDLGDKALNKLARINGLASQTGSGLIRPISESNDMPLGLSPVQLQRFNRFKRKPLENGIVNESLVPKKRHRRKIRNIKRTSMKKKAQTTRRRRVGGIGIRIKNKRGQIGLGRKRRRRTKKKRTRKSKSKRQLDIFN